LQPQCCGHALRGRERLLEEGVPMGTSDGGADPPATTLSSSLFTSLLQRPLGSRSGLGRLAMRVGVCAPRILAWRGLAA
jgi:hypothetical protein